jgi:Phosphopantetheine attachment site
MTTTLRPEPPPSGQNADPASQTEAQEPGQEPGSPSEKYLAALWSEIIGLDHVLLPNKFLEVGGNSLTLNIILNRVEIETGVALDAQLFYDDDRSSLVEIAKQLDVLRAQGPGNAR